VPEDGATNKPRGPKQPLPGLVGDPSRREKFGSGDGQRFTCRFFLPRLTGGRFRFGEPSDNVAQLSKLMAPNRIGLPLRVSS